MKLAATVERKINPATPTAAIRMISLYSSFFFMISVAFFM